MLSLEYCKQTHENKHPQYTLKALPVLRSFNIHDRKRKEQLTDHTGGGVNWRVDGEGLLIALKQMQESSSTSSS
jgi:hypothetical protein